MYRSMRSQGGGRSRDRGLGHRARLVIARRRRIGVGIHAVGAGQDALEGGEAADQAPAASPWARPLWRRRSAGGFRSAAVRQSSSGPKTMKKSSLSPGRTRLRRRSMTPCLSGNSGIAAPLEHDRRLVQAGDDADAAAQLVEEGGVGLRGMLGNVRRRPRSSRRRPCRPP